MRLFKPYTNIKDFLHRFTIINVGTLHIRIHKILSEDKSTLLHNHPFNYISIILKGQYTETYINKGDKAVTVTHKRFSVIRRNNTTFHTITEVKAPTYTLFIAYGKYQWKAYNTIPDTSNDGIFQRTINQKLVWSKKENGIWFIGNIERNIAMKETRHSIHQIL